jgi:hypothetical protein
LLSGFVTKLRFNSDYTEPKADTVEDRCVYRITPTGLYKDKIKMDSSRTENGMEP